MMAQFFGDRVQKKKKKKRTFFLVDFPWIFDAAAKSRMLRIEAKIAQRDEQRDMIMHGMPMSAGALYLIVKVNRSNIIEDAMNCLVNAGNHLRKPLKVFFEGEPGVDEGGVQKEFF